MKSFIILFSYTIVFQSYNNIYYRADFRTDGSKPNQSIVKALQGSRLYLEKEKSNPIAEENIWRGPVVILRCVASRFEQDPKYPV